MGTFHLGLSMAGTVSAGTYTAGTLVEINNWLSAWQKARTEGATVAVSKSIGPYALGQKITFTKEEIPAHLVKIKSMTGASGGGVNAGLMLAGLSIGKMETVLKERWMSFDVMDMLNTDDLEEGKPFYSMLNVKTLDNLVEGMLKEKFSDINFAKDIEYLDDDLEVFFTLASLAGVAYQVTPSGGNNVSYGVHKTHFDYIKFNFSKNNTPIPHDPTLPYAYNLLFHAKQSFRNSTNWKQFMDSCRATAAFPMGFQPRVLERYRNEYTGKLFYLDYTNAKDEYIKYVNLKPYWKPTNGNDDPFEMVYVDGGTFNREPHDLARASVLQSLGLGDKMDHQGEKTNACVILIDPFASNVDKMLSPGQLNEDDNTNEFPSLFKQIPPLLGAMMDQGRFRPDWIERAVNEKYYSRYLISPIRRVNKIKMDLPLAAGLLGAFSGFFDKSYLEHDYDLGRYNTCQFLKVNFAVPQKNEIVNYYENANAALKEKYEAVGWYDQGHCQVIPRMVELNDSNSVQPDWPQMKRTRWNQIRTAAAARVKKLETAVVELPWLFDGIVDKVIWKRFLKDLIETGLDNIEKELLDNKLLEKK